MFSFGNWRSVEGNRPTLSCMVTKQDEKIPYRSPLPCTQYSASGCVILQLWRWRQANGSWHIQNYRSDAEPQMLAKFNSFHHWVRFWSHLWLIWELCPWPLTIRDLRSPLTRHQPHTESTLFWMKSWFRGYTRGYLSKWNNYSYLLHLLIFLIPGSYEIQINQLCLGRLKMVLCKGDIYNSNRRKGMVNQQHH